MITLTQCQKQISSAISFSTKFWESGHRVAPNGDLSPKCMHSLCGRHMDAKFCSTSWPLQYVSSMMYFPEDIKLQLWSNFNDPVTTWQISFALPVWGINIGKFNYCRDFLWTTCLYTLMKVPIVQKHQYAVFAHRIAILFHDKILFLEPAVSLNSSFYIS